MQRITSKMISNSMTFNLNRQKVEMDRLNNSLATGKAVNLPRDNPISATNQMQYMTRLTEIDQYLKNTTESRSRLQEVDTAVQSTLRIFHRLRTLTIQGANGIYSSFERKEAAAAEINQLLEEIVAIANTKGATGRPIFGGHKTDTNENPFVPIYTTKKEGKMGTAMIGVEYRGDVGEAQREVAKGEYLTVNIPGNKLFWGSNQIVTSGMDGSAYRAPSNQSVKIDGFEIDIAAGDNIDVIIDKINSAGITVKASKGGNSNLIFETTSPHQAWMEDIGSGTVLQDLGIVNSQANQPPNNINPTATVAGQSIFDMVIQLRDDLVRGDVEVIGGRDIALMDASLDNLVKHIASVGARQNRVDELNMRGEHEKSNLLELLSKTQGIDMAESIMNFKWLESVNKYALAVGAKSIKPTLMDFLR